MKKLSSLNKEQIEKINDILIGEYYFFMPPLKTADDIRYELFQKGYPCFNGEAIIKIYEYLKSIGVGIK